MAPPQRSVFTAEKFNQRNGLLSPLANGFAKASALPPTEAAVTLGADATAAIAALRAAHAGSAFALAGAFLTLVTALPAACFKRRTPSAICFSFFFRGGGFLFFPFCL